MFVLVKEVESKLCEILHEVGDNSFSNEELVKCEDLTSLGYDSIALMNIIVRCEEEFSFEFDDDELVFSNISSFPALYKCIVERMQDS